MEQEAMVIRNTRLNRFYPKRIATKELKRKIGKLAAVNVVDMPTDGDIGGQQTIDFPEEFPAGEIPDNQNSAAEGLYKRPRQAEIGQGITPLTTEREQGKTKQKDTQHGMWSDSYHDENRFEDADMKLGELDDPIYPPYSNEHSPVDSRYEDVDKDTYDITLHAKNSGDHDFDKLWVCMDLDGTLLSKPDEYLDDHGNHIFGTALPGASEALQKLIDDGARVSIYTARQYFDEESEVSKALGMSPDQLLEFQVEEALIENDIPFTDIYIGKKPPAHFYVDDRTIPPFDGDWDMVIDTVRKKLEEKSRKEASFIPTDMYLTEQEFTQLSNSISYIDSMPQLKDFYHTTSSYYRVAEESGEQDQKHIASILKTKILNQIKVLNRRKSFKIVKANDPVKDQINYQGIKIDIEWPRGSIRSYEGQDTYVTHMKADYGYARGVEGNDGEELDIYLVDRDSDSPAAYIIEQLKADGSYDEDKIVLGAYSEGEAADIYLQHMPEYMLGDIREIPVERLVNALYGEPEDRRGEEDEVPKEELDKTIAFRIIASYSDLAMRAINQANISPLSIIILEVVDPSVGYVGMIDELSRAMLKDDSLKQKIESLVFPSTRPHLQYPDVSEEELENLESSIGPTGTQKIVHAMIKCGTKTWPEDDIFENEYTDGTEDRENRDIPRDNDKETYGRG